MSKEALVELRNIHKIYRLGETEVPALRGVSLTIHRGEFTALVGASGSGKSTLLNIVGTIDSPTEGTVFWEGRNVAELSEQSRASLRNRKIGFVFQTFNLVPVLDVFENIELPLAIQPLTTLERKERVEAAIEEVGLKEFIKHWPDRLSGGQRQRVAIARALVTRPELIIADEPTANLDSETASRIVDLLLSLNKKRNVTFLFSSHDEKLMTRVTRTVRIKDGTIQADSQGG